MATTVLAVTDVKRLQCLTKVKRLVERRSVAGRTRNHGRVLFGQRSDRGNDNLGFAAGAAFAAFARERFRHRKRCGDELHLLSPSEAETLLDATVAVPPRLTFNQKIADLFWDQSVGHGRTPNATVSETSKSEPNEKHA